MTILVVDDSLMIRKSMKAIIESLNHTVLTASNGKEAIEIYKSKNPDLVTMDIAMPEMNGISALKHIKKIDDSAVVIMATSNGLEDLVMEAMKNGALDYILKPATASKLEEAIKKAFNQDRYMDNLCKDLK